MQALRDGGVPDDARVGPSGALDWLPDVHEWQIQQLAKKESTTRHPDSDPASTGYDGAAPRLRSAVAVSALDAAV
ncbi:MAG TPA: hypothetical protein VIU11_18180 [Nakamurella sp.]